MQLLFSLVRLWLAERQSSECESLDRSLDKDGTGGEVSGGKHWQGEGTVVCLRNSNRKQFSFLEETMAVIVFHGCGEDFDNFYLEASIFGYDGRKGISHAVLS